LARIKTDGTSVIIQDKRVNIWETIADDKVTSIEIKDNPCIGVESAQYNNYYAPQDRNIVRISWGVRTDSWSIDSTNNAVIFNTAIGGKYKSVNDFVNGDLTGGRLYFPNGKYRRILSTLKQGSAINFALDVLDINDVSADGGETFIQGNMCAVPDCEEVEILFTPNPEDNRGAFEESFVFPVNELLARMDVLVYGDPFVLYNVKYRYKCFEEYTEYKAFPSDAVGYLNELSYDPNGNPKATEDLVKYPYTSDNSAGYIKLLNSPDSLRKFKDKVDKGDIIGVEEITNLSSTTIYDLIVGQNKNYIYISGNIGLSNDVYFNLHTAEAKDGNEFRIHINCASLNLTNYFIYIVENYASANERQIKKIFIGDVYQMLNKDGGIIFTLKFKSQNPNISNSGWVMSQNYELGATGEVKTVDGFIVDLFDDAGMGKVMGLYGYALMDGRNSMPNIKQKFLVAADPATSGYNEKQTGGAAKVALTTGQLPNFSLKIANSDGSDDDIDVNNSLAHRSDGRGNNNYTLSGTATEPTFGNTSSIGNNEEHENLPPYYAIIYAKKKGW
jgi:microcystin-dependent protein